MNMMFTKPPIQQIIDEVCKEHKTHPVYALSKLRWKEYVQVRQTVSYRALAAGYTINEICAAIGRDRSSVVNGIVSYQNREKMPPLIHRATDRAPKRKFTYKLVKSIAAQYPTRGKFQEADKAAYKWALQLGYLDDFYPRPSYAECKAEAAKYKGREAFRRGNHPYYAESARKGYLDEFFPPKDMLAVNPHAAQIVRQLAAELERNGVTVPQVAKLSGVDARKIYRWFEGTSPRTTELEFVLQAIGARLEISI